MILIAKRLTFRSDAECVTLGTDARCTLVSFRAFVSYCVRIIRKEATDYEQGLRKSPDLFFVPLYNR